MRKFGLFTLLVVFVLIGCNTDQSASKLATSAPTIESFSAYPSALPVGGGEVTLSWNTTGAAGLWVYPDIQSVTGLNKKVITVRKSKGFTLIATSTAGVSVENKVSITVKDPKPATLSLIVSHWGSIVNYVEINDKFAIGNVIYRHTDRDSGKPLPFFQVEPGFMKIKFEIREYFGDTPKTIEATEKFESGKKYNGFLYFNEGIPVYKQIESVDNSQSTLAKVIFLNLIKKPKTKLYLYPDGTECVNGKPPISTAEDPNSLITLASEIPFEGVFVKDFQPGSYKLQYILPPENPNDPLWYDSYTSCFDLYLDGGKRYISYLTREPSESGSPVGSVAD